MLNKYKQHALWFIETLIAVIYHDCKILFSDTDWVADKDWSILEQETAEIDLKIYSATLKLNKDFIINLIFKVSEQNNIFKVYLKSGFGGYDSKKDKVYLEEEFEYKLSEVLDVSEDDLFYKAILNSNLYKLLYFLIKKPNRACYKLLQKYKSCNYRPAVFYITGWLQVLSFKLKLYLTEYKKLKLANKCKDFIISKLEPLFSESLCNAKLIYQYNKDSMPWFSLTVETCDKLYSINDLLKKLDTTYAEYLIADWNTKYKDIHELQLHLGFMYKTRENTKNLFFKDVTTLCEFKQNKKTTKVTWNE